MGIPSQYELDAWREVQEFQGRTMSSGVAQVNQAAGKAASKVGNLAVSLGDKAHAQVEARPQAKAIVDRARVASSKGADLASKAAKKAAASSPNWTGTAVTSIGSSLARASRVGLSPKGVVKKHQKAGHEVKHLADVRRLDLEQVDELRGRTTSWSYPLAAAMSGAGAALAMTGGQLVVVVGAGASAAPGGAAVAGAFVADAAAVLALSSRAAGQVALTYGYDPEAPAEKVFIMSVVNAGTAASSGAKSAALKDVSKLTQALVRKKTWDELNKSVLSKITTQFAKSFNVRWTQQSLGKVVPAAGIAVSGALNWATLESIVDTADFVYRRRFLLEKYPDLGSVDIHEAFSMPGAEPVADEEISIVSDLELEGVVLDEEVRDGRA
ncbi:EcsC family protein [Arsenicicoccus bolidensis]|uniref:EcsC family protein n=1 Tax=Arsenicicoccus bolidensis TaxID=229480 RepID=UPI000492C275|nr:EcsC family protein [Arsenicicoccus bolidensis]